MSNLLSRTHSLVLVAAAGAALALQGTACSSAPADEATASQEAITPMPIHFPPILKDGSPLGPTYEAANAQHAQQALQAFLGGTSGQIDGGENLPRLNHTSGTMMWHDANTVEMILDYYEATLATGTADSSFLPIVESYKGYNPSYPFSVSTYLSVAQILAALLLEDPMAVIIASNIGAVAGNVGPVMTSGPYSGYIQNTANDDLLWWALSFIRAYQDLKDPWYLGAAEGVFATVCAQWDSVKTCGGGVPWGAQSSPSYLNAIPNELFFQTATKLALLDPSNGMACPGQYPGVVPAGQIPGGVPASPGSTLRQAQGVPNTFEGWAWAEYQWLNQYFIRPGALVVDGLDASTCAPTGPAWTYNQAPIIGGLVDLAGIAAGKDDLSVSMTYYGGNEPATILGQAFSLASQVMAPSPGGLTVPDGSLGAILTESCDDPGQKGCLASGSGDEPEFKGIFARYLGHVALDVPAVYAKMGGSFSAATYAEFMLKSQTFLEQNAAAIWANSLDAGTLTESWGVKQSSGYSSFFAQATETSGIDGLIAGVWAPNAPECHEQYCSDGECCGVGRCTSAGTCCPGPIDAEGACCVGALDSNGQCCLFGDTVVDGQCCANGQQCGSACCGSGQTCLNEAASQCGTPANNCSAGLVVCSYGGGSNAIDYCCYPDQNCNGSGPGCCGGTEGPPCIIK